MSDDIHIIINNTYELATCFWIPWSIFCCLARALALNLRILFSGTQSSRLKD